MSTRGLPVTLDSDIATNTWTTVRQPSKHEATYVYRKSKSNCWWFTSILLIITNLPNFDI